MWSVHAAGSIGVFLALFLFGSKKVISAPPKFSTLILCILIPVGCITTVLPFIEFGIAVHVVLLGNQCWRALPVSGHVVTKP